MWTSSVHGHLGIGLPQSSGSDASALRSERRVMPARNLRRPAAAIIAALSVDSCRLGTNVGHLARLAARLQLRAQPAVGRHAAGDADARAPDTAAPRRTSRSISAVDDDALKAGADVGDLALGQRRASVAAALAHVAQHRRLQAAEAEVEIALAARARCGRHASAASSAARPRDRCRSRASRSIDRPARIAEAEQLRHLVVRLARRIVARAAEQLVAPGPLDEIQAGVAAGHDQHDRRQRQLAVLSTSDSMWPARWCTATSGRPAAAAAAFANDTPTSSEPTRPGPCVTATAPRSRPGDAGVARARARRRRRCRGCAAATRAPARRRPTRDGSAPATRRRSSGSPRAARRRRSPRRRRPPSRRRRFRCRESACDRPITDPTCTRAASRLERALSDSVYGARKMPRSVMMPAMKLVRRHVERRIPDARAVGRQLRRRRRASPRVALRSSIGMCAPSGVFEIDRRQRRRDVERDVVLARQHGDACRCRSCWPCRRWRRSGRRRRRRSRPGPGASARRPCCR